MKLEVRRINGATDWGVNVCSSAVDQTEAAALISYYINIMWNVIVTHKN